MPFPVLGFSQQKDGGQGYDYIVRLYDNTVVGDRGDGNPAFLGAYPTDVPQEDCLAACPVWTENAG